MGAPPSPQLTTHTSDQHLDTGALQPPASGPPTADARTPRQEPRGLLAAPATATWATTKPPWGPPWANATGPPWAVLSCRHTSMCEPGRGTPSPLWPHSRREDPSPGTTEAPSQLLHSHLGQASWGGARGPPRPNTTRPPSRGGSSAHFFVDLHRLPFNAQPTASGQHGPNTWAPQPQARCPPSCLDEAHPRTRDVF